MRREDRNIVEYIANYVDTIVSPELIDITCIQPKECMVRNGEYTVSVAKSMLDCTIECEIIFEPIDGLFKSNKNEIFAINVLENEVDEDEYNCWESIYYGGDLIIDES